MLRETNKKAFPKGTHYTSPTEPKPHSISPSNFGSTRENLNLHWYTVLPSGIDISKKKYSLSLFLCVPGCNYSHAPWATQRVMCARYEYVIRRNWSRPLSPTRIGIRSKYTGNSNQLWLLLFPLFATRLFIIRRKALRRNSHPESSGFIVWKSVVEPSKG